MPALYMSGARPYHRKRRSATRTSPTTSDAAKIGGVRHMIRNSPT